MAAEAALINPRPASASDIIDLMLRALYDGRCFICRAARRIITALDWLNRVEFIDLHASGAWRSSHPALTDDRLMGAIHVLHSDGSLYAGYAGIRRLLKELPLGLPFWLLLQAPGMDRVGKRVYQFVARHRYSISRFFGRPPDCDCEISPRA